jgi:hypothetical protein
MKLKLLLTFDHELPLGGMRTSYKEAMFDPTEHLFELAEKLEIPIVLFTDVLCGIRYKEWDNNSFYKPYVKQLQDAILKYHDVQLHLHPHWLTSTFENNTFIPSKDYRLADFKTDKTYPIDTIIKTGIDFLKEECRKINQNYECIAFRAGGFNIEEATEEIITSLYKNGIRFDSSISKGYYFRSGLSEVNFLNMPSAPNWLLGTGGNIRKESSNKGIFEVPLASIPKTPFEMPTRFKLKKLSSQAPRDHGFQIHEGSSSDLKSRFKMLFASRMLSFDNYTLSIDYLMKILNYNVRKYADNQTVILSVIGHPKTMGDYSFFLMESFVKRVRQKYPDAEFTTFSKLAEEMKMD